MFDCHRRALELGGMKAITNEEGMLNEGICALTQLTSLEIAEELPSSAFLPIAGLLFLENLSINVCATDQEPASLLPLRSYGLTSLSIDGSNSVTVSQCPPSCHIYGGLGATISAMKSSLCLLPCHFKRVTASQA